VVSQPGSIRRLQVAIVVKKPLTPAQQEQLSKTVAASVGAAPDRGDTVVVQGLDAALSPIAAPAVPAAAPAPPAAEPSPAAGSSVSWPLDSVARLVGVAVVGLVLLVLAGLFLRRGAQPAVPVLSDAERQVALEQVRVWMRNGPAEPGRVGVVQGLAAPRSAGGAV
jgi:flagellar M-ring protein FliF